ncbi:receptor-like serine/threonine-protein kinase At2g45590 [Populus alba]|uniref:non-specific serine/threonine protein kinase n=1 Tax=Populus alba TaxID=43335 RepID=A0A4U5QZS4_POPAL|nr:receptor-like serine/threonine-protein kinase At2g45590 [Populus alba]TKS14625.1 kinase family protein [Populus alba]
MPSRHLRSLSPPPPPPPPPLHHHHLLAPLLAGTLTLFLIFIVILVILLYRKITRNRTAPITKSPNHHHQQCRCYSYSLLRRATSSFSPSNRLGHGGFGSVYKATLPNTNQHLAVKLMDQNGSLQGEREFHNELSIASCLDSPNIVSLLGYSCSRKKKLILVYELMENRSLQEALFDRKCEELMNWKVRFDIVIGVAKGLEYLHHFCNPPVIHGDIKPSNILLDSFFNAKIGDFGLARLKIEESNVVEKKEGLGEENGSILEETESVVSGCGESGIIAVGGVERSPESFGVRVLESDASPEMVSPEVGVDKGSVSEAGFDKMSVDSGRDLIGGGKKGGSRRDWWWKQDNGGGSESGRVKDYVMEWIGSEINKERRPKQEWNVVSPGSSDNKLSTESLKIEPKKHKKRLEWWASLDEGRMKKKEKNRKPREWWKEEFCEELTKKKKRGLSSSNSGDLWWQKDDDLVQERRKKRKSKGSIDWWLDGFSGEFRNGRRNSQDWASGEIPKSGGISSTPSMRGTVCYIAPEYGGGGLLSEKCDVYSFGVLLLVVVSGRRPLQVTASPMSEFERANLISWARQLAYNGKLLDLVDPSILSLDKDQALLCITIGLLCLQRSPSKRPTMKEIVGMLSGEAEPPHLPFEFSPSPPSNFPFKSPRKAR